MPESKPEDPSDLIDPSAPSQQQGDSSLFPVVGIGASAGGLAAIETFFRHMPVGSGMGFVVISHLDPSRPSMLAEIIQATTSMAVSEVVDDVKVQPNHVYVIAPDSDLTINGGHLRLVRPRSAGTLKMPVDIFFRSLADDCGTQAIGIVLSGSGTDGTEGVNAIKIARGRILVQDTESAEYQGMPESAKDTGLADDVLNPEEMPARLIQYQQQLAQTDEIHHDDREPSEALKKIFVILKSRTGHDFSLYKRNTLMRRIERRMAVHLIEEIDEYVRHLRESERESETLFNELLIGVTSFFRDEEVFSYLENVAIPELLANKSIDDALRIWVVGCSTGQEAYSIAILLHECIKRADRFFQVQVFATDIDKGAIDIARSGTYCKSDTSNVSQERLSRYFTVTPQGQLQVKETIREMLVFAQQDVNKDPPFTKLDLLSCRNLLIYFRPELQSQLLPIFHYSLNSGGLLLLGSSESIGQQVDLFSTVDSKCKLFRKKPMHSPEEPLRMPSYMAQRDTTFHDSFQRGASPSDLGELSYVEAILGESNSPPCVIVDNANEVVYIHGRTGLFLEPAVGKANMNIVDMARPGIKAEISSALRQLKESRTEVIRTNLEVNANGTRTNLTLTFKPLVDSEPLQGLSMIVFASQPSDGSHSAVVSSGKTLEDVEAELRDTRETLQSLVENKQAANEELKSTNEELQSINEELQSTNEELQTSKEELQSMNEESMTVNGELQLRNHDLATTGDDLKNLLDSTEIATLFIDGELRVRNYTPRATDLIPLQPSDKGRLISNYATNLNGQVDLGKIASQVLEDLVIREMEVSSKDNNIYLLRARPYRTVANMIDGVVLTFENVTKLKKAEQILLDEATTQGETKYLSLLKACLDGVIVSDPNGSILGANSRLCDLIGYREAELLKMKIQQLSHPDSIQETEDELRRAKELDTGAIPLPAVLQKSYVHKNGTVVSASVAVTWHRERLADLISGRMYRFEFIIPLANGEVDNPMG